MRVLALPHSFQIKKNDVLCWSWTVAYASPSVIIYHNISTSRWYYYRHVYNLTCDLHLFCFQFICLYFFFLLFAKLSLARKVSREERRWLVGQYDWIWMCSKIPYPLPPHLRHVGRSFIKNIRVPDAHTINLQYTGFRMWAWVWSLQ